MTAAACGYTGTVNHAVQLVGVDLRNASRPYWIVRNQWGTGWGTKGFIRLQYGTNTCGITSFLCYVTTTLYNPNIPIAPPTRSPILRPSTNPAIPSSSTSLKPSSVPTVIKTPSIPTKAPVQSLHREESTSSHTDRVNAVSLSSARSHSRLRTSLTESYSYLDSYIPPSLQSSGAVPVHYYSSQVQSYYSPKPRNGDNNFRYYGTVEPTVTHYPSSRSLGRFGYSVGATPKPTKMPLVYYGYFQKIHSPSIVPTLGALQLQHSKQTP
eukprot:gene6290-biopygen6661